MPDPITARVEPQAQSPVGEPNDTNKLEAEMIADSYFDGDICVAPRGELVADIRNAIGRTAAAKDAEIATLRKLVNVAESALARLAAVVHEQQYTLTSKGWKDDGNIVWSAAGARKHQYENIEAALRDAGAVLEKRSKASELVSRLLKIQEAARRTCKVGHSPGCKCWCCEVVCLCDEADAALRASGVKLEETP